MYIPALRYMCILISVLLARELKDDALSSELTVDLSESVNLVVHGGAVLGVKEDLDHLVAVLLGADTLSDDLGGVDEVAEDGVVHSGQGAVARALLLDARTAAGEWQDAALGDEDDVAVGKFLLELTGQAGDCVSGRYRARTQ